VKDKPNIGSPFSGMFPSDRIHKATKDANLYLQFYNLPHLSIPANYVSEFRETFEVTLYRFKNWYVLKYIIF
jgi:hypothetical protein